MYAIAQINRKIDLEDGELDNSNLEFQCANHNGLLYLDDGVKDINSYWSFSRVKELLQSKSNDDYKFILILE